MLSIQGYQVFYYVHVSDFLNWSVSPLQRRSVIGETGHGKELNLYMMEQEQNFTEAYGKTKSIDIIESNKSLEV